MSVFTEIQRIKNAKESMKNAIADKGVLVPSSAQLDDLPEYIRKLSSGVEKPRYVESITLDDNGFPVTLVLNSSATTIPDYCFSKSKNLKSISMPYVTSIGYIPFNECENLEYISMPVVQTIGPQLLWWHNKITSIEFPDTLRSIGDWFICYCSSLTTVIIRAITPPTNGGNIIRECPNLTNIYVPAESVEAYKTASGWSEYASKFTAIQ